MRSIFKKAVGIVATALLAVSGITGGVAPAQAAAAAAAAAEALIAAHHDAKADAGLGQAQPVEIMQQQDLPLLRRQGAQHLRQQRPPAGIRRRG